MRETNYGTMEIFPEERRRRVTRGVKQQIAKTWRRGVARKLGRARGAKFTLAPPARPPRVNNAANLSYRRDRGIGDGYATRFCHGPR